MLHIQAARAGTVVALLLVVITLLVAVSIAG